MAACNRRQTRHPRVARTVPAEPRHRGRRDRPVRRSRCASNSTCAPSTLLAPAACLERHVAVRRLPLPDQDRLLPALRRGDGGAAALQRHPRAGGGRLRHRPAGRPRAVRREQDRRPRLGSRSTSRAWAGCRSTPPPATGCPASGHRLRRAGFVDPFPSRATPPEPVRPPPRRRPSISRIQGCRATRLRSSRRASVRDLPVWLPWSLAGAAAVVAWPFGRALLRRRGLRRGTLDGRLRVSLALLRGDLRDHGARAAALAHARGDVGDPAGRARSRRHLAGRPRPGGAVRRTRDDEGRSRGAGGTAPRAEAAAACAARVATLPRRQLRPPHRRAAPGLRAPAGQSREVALGPQGVVASASIRCASWARAAR